MGRMLRAHGAAHRSAVVATAMLACGLLTGWSLPVARPAPGLTLAEPARICGTNSSRSRRCNFGHQDCLKAGKGEATCNRALSICRSCIDVMVACQRQPASACATCIQRYSDCMAPWVEMLSR